MEAKLIWLAVFVALYVAWCLFWGVRGALAARTATDYFIAGRGLPFWLFVLAATATSFTGWVSMGHPGMAYADAFPYACVSLAAIAIPLTGVLFLKRQWILGRRFGFVTPGEMLAYYFRSDAIRILVIIVALLFAVPFLAIQLRAAGFLLHALTDGRLGVEVGMGALAALVFLYVAAGGLRAVAWVDAVQCLLLAAGVVIIGAVVLHAVGGWSALGQDIGLLAGTDTALTPDGDSHRVAAPGVIPFGADGPSAEGRGWTGIMILTSVLALMGIQSAPAFSTWAFASRDPAPFAPQQVWASSFAIGIILLLLAAMQGMGGHFLGVDPKVAAAHPDRIATDAAQRIQANFFETRHRDAVLALDITPDQLRALAAAALRELGRTGQVPTIAQMAQAGDPTASALIAHEAGLGEEPALGDLLNQAGGQAMLVPQLIELVADAAPWLAGLLAVCALAAMASIGAAAMSASGLLTRDLIRHFLMPHAGHGPQKLLGRIAVAVIVLLALLVASTSTDDLAVLGGLALAYGLQMWPALIAVCYWPFLTGAGVVLGLIAGLVAVTLTETIGQTWFGITAWGRWPLTIHSAGWGIACNLAVALAVSAISRDDMDRKMEFHNFLAQHAMLPAPRRKLIAVAWVLAVAWFCFAVVPGVVIGNRVFGGPSDPAGWMFGISSIWAWQLLWWALGVAMIWFLAHVMQMSTVPQTEVEPLAEDIAEIQARI